MPQLQHFPLDSRHPSFRRSDLPAALDTWPQLKYMSDFGIFVAGLAQLNPAIMRAALRRDAEAVRGGAELHELPTEAGALEALIEKVEIARKLREQCKFARDW